MSAGTVEQLRCGCGSVRFVEFLAISPSLVCRLLNVCALCGEAKGLVP